MGAYTDAGRSVGRRQRLWHLQLDEGLHSAQTKQSGRRNEKHPAPALELCSKPALCRESQYRTTKLSQMVSVFHQAFLNALERKDQSSDFMALKDRYYRTVFAGCSEDLRRDCANVSVFSNDSRFMRIMTRLAQELDPTIDQQLKTYISPTKCVQRVKSVAKPSPSAIADWPWRI